MNKAALVKKVSDRTEIPSNATKVIVDTIFDSMRQGMEKGEGVETRGFGTFTVRKPAGDESNQMIPKITKLANTPLLSLRERVG